MKLQNDEILEQLKLLRTTRIFIPKDEVLAVVIEELEKNRWIDVNERLPKDTSKDYLCCCEENYYLLLGFSSDLYKFDKFDFHDKKGVAGFYDYDSEWGYSHIENVTRWKEII